MKYLIIMSLILFGCGKSEDTASVKDNTVVVKPVPKPDPKPDPDPIPDPIPDPKPDPKPTPKAEHFYKLCMDENYIGEGRHTINVIMQVYNLPTCLDAAIWLNRNYKLKLYKKEITSLEPIKEVTNLTYIDVGNNKISDLSDLEKLSGFEVLAIDNNQQISSVDVVKNFKNLSSLILEGNPIRDLTALCEIKNIEWIDFRNIYEDRNREIKGLECLGNHKNMKLLYMSNLKIDDPSFITDMIDLEYLVLTYSNLKSLEFLSKKYDNLKVLGINNTDLVSLSNVENFINLEATGITNTKIQDISQLHSLSKLQSLVMYDDQIKKNDINCPKNKELPKPIKEFCFDNSNQDI